MDDTYTSQFVIGLVAAVALTGVGLLAAPKLIYRQIGVFMLGLSAAYGAGAATSERWPAFTLVVLLTLSHQVAWVLHSRRTSRAGQRAEPAAGPVTAAPKPFTIMTRADDYNKKVAEIETRAVRVDKTLQRLNTVFKAPELALAVAAQRYGSQSGMYESYVEAHAARREAFFQKLRAQSLRHREICSRLSLEAWLRSPTHADVGNVPRELIDQQVYQVIDALRRFPQNYSLALTDGLHPFLYAIYDGEIVVLHEAVGGADMYRVNAMFIEDPQALAAFGAEFELLWQRTPKEYRDNQAVASWLEAAIGSGVRSEA